MAEQKGDLKYYENQPYDLEMVVDPDEEESRDQGRPPKKNRVEEEDEPAYQEVKVSPPVIKALPKFDITKFQDLAKTPEQKELLSIMQR